MTSLLSSTLDAVADLFDFGKPSDSELAIVSDTTFLKVD